MCIRWSLDHWGAGRMQRRVLRPRFCLLGGSPKKIRRKFVQRLESQWKNLSNWIVIVKNYSCGNRELSPTKPPFQILSECLPFRFESGQNSSLSNLIRTPVWFEISGIFVHTSTWLWGIPSSSWVSRSAAWTSVSSFESHFPPENGVTWYKLNS